MTHLSFCSIARITFFLHKRLLGLSAYSINRQYPQELAMGHQGQRVSFPPVDYVLELIPLSSLTNQSALNP